MNRLTPAKRTRVIAALVEGDSIRATVRMTGVSKNAIQRLLAALGPACERYQDRALCNLSCKRIQCGKWQPSGAPKLCTICSGRVIAVIYPKWKTPRGQARRFVPHAGGDSRTRYPLF